MLLDAGVGDREFRVHGLGFKNGVTEASRLSRYPAFRRVKECFTGIMGRCRRSGVVFELCSRGSSQAESTLFWDISRCTLKLVWAIFPRSSL